MAEAQDIKFQINFSASFQSSSTRIQRQQSGEFQQVFQQQRDQASTQNNTDQVRRDSRPELETDRTVNDRSRAEESQRGRDSNASDSDRNRSSEASNKQDNQFSQRDDRNTNRADDQRRDDVPVSRDRGTDRKNTSANDDDLTTDQIEELSLPVDQQNNVEGNVEEEFGEHNPQIAHEGNETVRVIDEGGSGAALTGTQVQADTNAAVINLMDALAKEGTQTQVKVQGEGTQQQVAQQGTGPQIQVDVKALNPQAQQQVDPQAKVDTTQQQVDQAKLSQQAVAQQQVVDVDPEAQLKQASTTVIKEQKADVNVQLTNNQNTTQQNNTQATLADTAKQGETQQQGQGGGQSAGDQAGQKNQADARLELQAQRDQARQDINREITQQQAKSEARDPRGQQVVQTQTNTSNAPLTTQNDQQQVQQNLQALNGQMQVTSSNADSGQGQSNNSNAGNTNVSAVNGLLNAGKASSGTPSVSSTSATSQTESTSVAQQVVKGIRAAVNQKGGTVTLNLNPQELGQMKIKLQINNGVVQASFTAANTQVKDLLDQNMSTLRKALENHGLAVDRLNVQAPSPQDNTQANQQNNQGQDGRSRGQMQDQGGSQRQGDQQHEGQAGQQRGFKDELLDMVA